MQLKRDLMKESWKKTRNRHRRIRNSSRKELETKDLPDSVIEAIVEEEEEEVEVEDEATTEEVEEDEEIVCRVG